MRPNRLVAGGDACARAAQMGWITGQASTATMLFSASQAKKRRRKPGVSSVRVCECSNERLCQRRSVRNSVSLFDTSHTTNTGRAVSDRKNQRNKCSRGEDLSGELRFERVSVRAASLEVWLLLVWRGRDSFESR